MSGNVGLLSFMAFMAERAELPAVPAGEGRDEVSVVGGVPGGDPPARRG